ncbi:nitroreductase/quinone reductase family protein [Streptomyces sp. HPF1205]|uniref:nitroreductase/quinone reductase family protein n=1 Tax=Streptomyces sp. HPF1205 TaxID=2873262 RepID=UPI001CEC7852|nr:nitroreductase/quinone reductase family protein [Streptomyces sp. HPF1205]
MSTTTARPEITTALKVRNKIMALFHNVGIPVGPVHLLRVRGRVSGKEYTNPVAPVRVDGTQYVLQAFPRSDWVKNVRAAGEGVLVRGRKQWHVRLVEVPAPERGPIVRELPRQVPMGVSIFVKNGLVENGSPESFERAAPDIPVFRVVPD